MGSGDKAFKSKHDETVRKWNSNLKLLKLLRIRQILVAGWRYHFTTKVKDEDKDEIKVIRAEVWDGICEKHLMDFKELADEEINCEL